MTDVAIRCEGLGKRYRIGPRERYKALRDSVAKAFSTAGSRVRATLGGSERARTDDDKTFWALRDISFEIRHGEVMGIVGRNGAGKSTLLKILSRITTPTAGSAELRGRIGSLLEVGTGFHPELTGRENIFLNGAILGMRKAEIRGKFDEIVSFAEVEKFIDTPVKHYSSGMYVRLAFAVAAHLEPEILLVDEVLAVGDAEFQKKCLGRMGNISREGRTVLFVSHNMLSLQTLCTRGILMAGGRVVQDGDIGDVVRTYLQSATKQAGEVVWASVESAPGDHRVRLKAVRLMCEDVVRGEVDISKDCRIEVDYWNLEPNGRRVVGINIYNAMGVCVISAANLPSACLAPDPWYFRSYPTGLFRTTCSIPGSLLNDGVHSIAVAIHGRAVGDNSFYVPDALSFTVADIKRDDYMGKWISAVRPRLRWETVQLS